MLEPRFKGWPVAELGMVATVNERLMDVRLPPGKPLYFINMLIISPETTLAEPTEAKGRTPSDGALVVREGDVLLAKNSMSWEKGRVAVMGRLRGGIGFVEPGIHVICPGRRLSARWLWHLLRQPSLPKLLGPGPSVPGTWHNFKAEALQTLPLPLPPLAAQLRIVGLLDEAEDARHLQRESSAETERALTAAFSRTFGDADSRPNKSVTLASFIERVEKGGAPGAATLRRPASAGEYGLLTPSAVTSGRFLAAQNFGLGMSSRPPNLRAVARGDLLMAWMAAREEVGATALVEDIRDGLYLPETLWRLIPRPGVDAHFLKAFLSAPQTRQRMRDLASGSAVVKLSPNRLLSLPAFMPPPAAQERFADLYRALTDARGMQDELDAELGGLLDAMLSRAYASRPPSPAKARAKRAARKGSRGTRKRAARGRSDAGRPVASELAEAESRIIWGKLSDFQRAVWEAILTFGQQFRVGDIMRAVKVPAGTSADRERFLSALELLVSVGGVIKEGRLDADRWRRPDFEGDRGVGL